MSPSLVTNGKLISDLVFHFPLNFSPKKAGDLGISVILNVNLST